MHNIISKVPERIHKILPIYQNDNWVALYLEAAWCILGSKAKIDHLVWDAKLLLINMNYEEFFLKKKFYWQKKFDKIFHTYWCGKLIVVSKTMVLVIDLDEN